MPLEITATCEICGTARQSVNHWFIGRAHVNDSLVVLSYSLEEAKDRGGDILCGEVCLHKWLAKELVKLGDNDEQKPQEQS